MTPHLRCLLRRCANPLCRVLFHPARQASIYCRPCAALFTHKRKKETHARREAL